MLPNPHFARSYITLRIFKLSNNNSCHREDIITIYAGNLSLGFQYKDVLYGSVCDQNECQLSQIALGPYSVTKGVINPAHIQVSSRMTFLR
jgi:hypothetical protein